MSKKTKIQLSAYKETFEILKKIQLISEDELREVLSVYEEDKNFMVYVIEKNHKILAYCEKLKNDKKFVLERVINNGKILEILPEEFKKDHEVVYQAITNSILSINYVSSDLMNDPIFIRDTIKRIKKEKPYENGVYSNQLLKYASEQVKDNEDIIYEITNILPYTIGYVSDRLKDGKKIFLNILKDNPFLIQFASDRLKGDEDIISLVMSIEPRAYIYISEELKTKDIYIQKAFETDGATLELAPLTVKENKNHVLTAIKSNNNAYKYAGDNIKRDNEVIELALDRNADMIEFVPIDCQYNYMKIALENRPDLFEKIAEYLKYNVEIIEIAYEEIKSKHAYQPESYHREEMLELLPEDLRKEIVDNNLIIEDYIFQIKLKEKLESSMVDKVVKNKKKI